MIFIRVYLKIRHDKLSDNAKKQLVFLFQQLIKLQVVTIEKLTTNTFWKSLMYYIKENHIQMINTFFKDEVQFSQQVTELQEYVFKTNKIPAILILNNPPQIGFFVVYESNNDSEQKNNIYILITFD